MTSMMNNPSVSIIVRTKDRPKLLKNALRSISAQDYRPIEVVLVNDGGCDLEIGALRDVLGDIPLNYVRLQKNMGRAHAGNVGIENAKGEYLGFLDDDDEFHPNHVVTLVSFLDRSDYKIAYTDALMVYKEYDPLTHELIEEGRREVAFSYDFNFDRLVFENYIPFMCLLFGRQPLVTSGGFETSLELYEDWDLLIRIGKKYPFYHIKAVTANYNQWSADFQISQANRDYHFLTQTYLKVLSRHMKEITPKRIHGIISEYAHIRQILKDVRNESESLNNLLRERDISISDLGKELGEKDIRINGLSNELSGKDIRIDGLKNEIADRDDSIGNLNNELDGKNVEIDSLKNELSEREARINGLNKDVADRDARIGNLNNELDGKNVEVDGLKNELSERDVRINELGNELRERDDRITNLNNELLERESLVNKLNDELKEQASRIETLAADLKEKERQIYALSDELTKNASRISTLNSELGARDAQLRSLASVMEAKEVEIARLKNTVRETEGLITAMRNTRGWRILEKYRKIRDGVLSPLFGISHRNATGRSEK